MSKKIVIIGSGFGGLAAALRLRAKNYDVTLLEKHPDLGGRARVFKKDNFTNIFLFLTKKLTLYLLYF